MKTVLAVLIMACAAFAQSGTAPVAPPSVVIPAFSTQEQLDLRNLQVQDQQAQATLQAKQAAAQQLLLQQLQQSDEYQAAQETRRKLNAAVASMKAAHHVDETKVHLCDGPDGGYCKDVKVGELVFREVPVQQAKK